MQRKHENPASHFKTNPLASCKTIPALGLASSIFVFLKRFVVSVPRLRINLTQIAHKKGGAQLSEQASDGVAGVVDIDSLDLHDSPWLSGLLGELRPTFCACLNP
jgi:hypothetical protein